MRLVLIRIDDRLLHAQVALGWVGALSPEVVVVADDRLSGDQRQVSLMRMSLPPEVELVVAGVEESARLLTRDEAGARKCILIVRTPAEAVRLVEAGVPLAAVNVGGMHFAEGKVRLLPYVYVDRRDVEALGRLASWNVRLTAQDVPGNPNYDVVKLLEESGLRQEGLRGGGSGTVGG
jgi:mannose/fructose/N-acetylgalactosamine-specific phosphotransferase system component IIB